MSRLYLWGHSWDKQDAFAKPVEDFVVKEGGELRVHSEPRRYATCDELSSETWAKRIQRHAEFLVVDKPAGVPCVPHVSNGRALVAHWHVAAHHGGNELKRGTDDHGVFTDTLLKTRMIQCVTRTVGLILLECNSIICWKSGSGQSLNLFPMSLWMFLAFLTLDQFLLVRRVVGSLCGSCNRGK